MLFRSDADIDRHEVSESAQDITECIDYNAQDVEHYKRGNAGEPKDGEEPRMDKSHRADSDSRRIIYAETKQSGNSRLLVSRKLLIS